MATAAAAQKFFKFRLDGRFLLCNNRTNVRRMRGESMQDRGVEFEQWLMNATDQEKQELLAAIRLKNDAASSQERSPDLLV